MESKTMLKIRWIVFILIIFAFLSLISIYIFASPPPYELIKNLSYDKTGADITLNWDLEMAAQPDQGIAIFHKLQGQAVLDGATTSYPITINDYGVHHLSVLWLWEWGIFDLKTAEVQVGFLTWDPPATGPTPDGYMVYIFESEPDITIPPIGALAYDAGADTKISLTTLYFAGLIDAGKDYWSTVASYRGMAGEPYKWMSAQAGPVGPFRFQDKRLEFNPISNPAAEFEDVH